MSRNYRYIGLGEESVYGTDPASKDIYLATIDADAKNIKKFIERETISQKTIKDDSIALENSIIAFNLYPTSDNLYYLLKSLMESSPNKSDADPVYTYTFNNRSNWSSGTRLTDNIDSCTVYTGDEDLEESVFPGQIAKSMTFTSQQNDFLKSAITTEGAKGTEGANAKSAPTFSSNKPFKHSDLTVKILKTLIINNSEISMDSRRRIKGWANEGDSCSGILTTAYEYGEGGSYSLTAEDNDTILAFAKLVEYTGYEGRYIEYITHIDLSSLPSDIIIKSAVLKYTTDNKNSQDPVGIKFGVSLIAEPNNPPTTADFYGSKGYNPNIADDIDSVNDDFEINLSDDNINCLQEYYNSNGACGIVFKASEKHSSCPVDATFERFDITAVSLYIEYEYYDYPTITAVVSDKVTYANVSFKNKLKNEHTAGSTNVQNKPRIIKKDVDWTLKVIELDYGNSNDVSNLVDFFSNSNKTKLKLTWEGDSINGSNHTIEIEIPKSKINVYSKPIKGRDRILHVFTGKAYTEDSNDEQTVKLITDVNY